MAVLVARQRHDVRKWGASEKESLEFCEDIALRVCGYISEGLSLRKVEQQTGMPSKAGILKWLLEGEAFRGGHCVSFQQSAAVGGKHG
jgi:hypothetical protein